MKKTALFITILFFINGLCFAQTMEIHSSGEVGVYNLADIDSLIIDISEDTTGTVTDIDNNVYKTIKIGDQWWMAENLRVTHYRNGESIPNVTDSLTWAMWTLSTDAYCNYDNDTSYVGPYGRLYNCNAVIDSRNIGPEGWHVPTDEEWKQLEMYLGMSQSQVDSTGYRGTDEGGKLKEVGSTHWNSPNNGATNSSSFTALPGGFRNGHTGRFYSIGNYGFWWSATESGTRAWYRYLHYDHSDVHRNDNYKRYGYSVRLVRD